MADRTIPDAKSTAKDVGASDESAADVTVPGRGRGGPPDSADRTLERPSALPPPMGARLGDARTLEKPSVDNTIPSADARLNRRSSERPFPALPSQQPNDVPLHRRGSERPFAAAALAAPATEWDSSVSLPRFPFPAEGASTTIHPSAAPPDSVKLPDGALHVASTRTEDGELDWVHEPWSGERIAPVVLADLKLAERAAHASAVAFEAMRKMPAYARRRLLKEITRRIVLAREDFVTIIMREAGKPKTLARFEVDRAIVTFGLAAEEAVRIGGEVVPLDVTEPTAAYRGHFQRVPRGPVLAITPFNFPLNLVAHKVAPALACGAPVVLKPAPKTPLTALLLGEIVRAAGAPADALQVVPCKNEVAETLVRSNAFSVLSFTGSDKVGWHLKSLAGKKHVMLELGGNAACIVHEDATAFAQIAAVLCASAFNYSGQVCIKTQRLYVHRAIADRLLAELVPRACSYEPQDPRSTTSAIASMIDEPSAKRLEGFIDEARAAGAHALAIGKRDRNRMPATVLRIEGEGRGLNVVEEEAFGPVLTVHVYEQWSDALRMANASRYGLQAGLFTDSLSRVRDAYDRLDVGALIVNDVPSVRVDAMPYGGRRDSGIGREGVRYAIEEMTDRKMLVTRG